MAASYRLSGRVFDRESESTEPKRLFFLSVEGAETESSYFKHLNANLKDMGCPDATIHVLGQSKPHRPHPDDVFALLEECCELRGKGEEALLPVPCKEKLMEQFAEEEIKAFLNGHQGMPRPKIRAFKDALLSMGVNWDYRQYLKDRLSSEDRFVVVLDKDQQTHTKECLKSIATKCQARGFLCCLTNPCFEFWLLLHLVDASELSKPEELAKLLENKKISTNHTYVSKWVSKLATHAKTITSGKFKAVYKAKLQKARTAATRFATNNQDVLDKVGTTIPDLVNELFGPMP